MRSVNASEVVAASKFNRFHLFVFLWCFYAIAFDGYVRHRDVWGRLAMDDGRVGSELDSSRSYCQLFFGRHDARGTPLVAFLPQ
ncbi:hypothetical protein NST21_07895 [Peribacillus sp. FSL K6-1552]|uniref:hypothetical protein n=1 Tax=Peribacillus sp. FSL K6-1552 TaxID=2954514 RepID=UPI00070985F6|nr:hypothetical protein ASG99_00495 [Bacillus sp. Soil768D1]